MLHVSGTGASPKYGLISQMPLTTVEPPVNVLDNTTYWQKRVGNDSASVGYYKTSLENGVHVELSATHNAGIMQYHFPAGEKHVLVDVSHYIPNPTGGYASQTFQGGEISIDNATYSGYGVFAVAGMRERLSPCTFAENLILLLVKSGHSAVRTLIR